MAQQTEAQRLLDQVNEAYDDRIRRMHVVAAIIEAKTSALHTEIMEIISRRASFGYDPAGQAQWLEASVRVDLLTFAREQIHELATTIYPAL